jgi:hypothetical protein
MEKHCWVAVDKDGTEKISNSVFIRRLGCVSILWGMIKVNYKSKNQRNKWANGWSSDDNDPLPFFGVELPKGSIEKLIGRKMTWEEEPIDLNQKIK